MSSSLSPCASTTARSSRPRSSSTASAYARGGPNALAREMQRAQASGAQGPLFVRTLGAQQDVVFLSMPDAWRRFDLSQLATPPLTGEQMWASLDTGNGDQLEVASVRLPDGTLFQVGTSAPSAGRPARSIPSRAARALRLDRGDRAGGRRRVHVVGPAAGPRTRGRRAADPAHRPHRHARARRRHDRRIGAPERAVQRDARSHRCRRRRDARGARQRRARSCARRSPACAGLPKPRCSPDPATLREGLAECLEIQPCRLDAEHPDGHLGSGDRRRCSSYSNR